MTDQPAPAQRLIYRRTLKDGRVEAVNAWRSGHDVLIYRDMATFERAKVEVEQHDKVPQIVGYTPT